MLLNAATKERFIYNISFLRHWMFVKSTESRVPIDRNIVNKKKKVGILNGIAPSHTTYELIAPVAICFFHFSFLSFLYSFYNSTSCFVPHCLVLQEFLLFLWLKCVVSFIQFYFHSCPCFIVYCILQPGLFALLKRCCSSWYFLIQ